MMKQYWALIWAWPRYWILILVGALGLLTLYAVHLATGFVPDRVAFSVFDLPVYWYGMIIAAGIGLGAYLVADLATARAQRLFAQTVPKAVAKRPLSTLPFADDIQAHLQRQKLATLGDLLWLWGTNPAQLSLPAADRERVAVVVGQEPAVDPLWLEQPAWSKWSADHVWNGLLLCLVLGIIGARLYHIMTPSPSMTAFSSFQDYLNNPGQIFNLRRGGLGIYGGIAGGALGLWGYTRWRRLPLLGWMDLAVMGLALGQAVGRWANFFNQELYGRPTDLPWAVQVEPAFRLPAYAEFSQFHPAFLYESLWSFGTFLLLLWLYRRYGKRLWPGELTALYFVAYGIGRSLVELVRLDSRTLLLPGVNLEIAVATAVSLTMLLVALVVVGGRRWLKRETKNVKRKTENVKRKT